MKTGMRSESMSHWIQRQRRHMIGVAVIMFIGYVIADIVVGSLFPSTANAQASLEGVFSEMKLSSYWLKKLVFSIGGGVLYGVLLWYLKGQRLRES